MKSKRYFFPGLALAVAILIFLAWGIQSSLKSPFNSGPDEVAHFAFIKYVAQHLALPTTDAARTEAGYKSDWPPLFHVLGGLVGSGIDLSVPPFIKVVQDNPRLQLVVGNENIISWRALTTEDPLQSEVLLWYLGRWVTLFFSIAGIVAAFLLVLSAYPHQPWLAVGAAVTLGFIPTYTSISGVISYETLLGFLLTLYFISFFYLLRFPQKNWLYFVTGLLLSLAMLTKYTPVPLIPVLPGVVLWLAHQERWPWAVTGRRLGLTGLGLMLPLGSWLFYVVVYFNRITEDGWVFGLFTPFLSSDGSDETSMRFLSFISAGNLGKVSTRYNDAFFSWVWHMFSEMFGGGWVAWLFAILFGLAAVGLVRQWFLFKPGKRLWVLVLVVSVVMLWLLPLARFLLTWQVSTGMGQHVLLPTGAALMLLLVYGLNGWLTTKHLAGFFLGLALICLLTTSLTMFNRTYPPPFPLQTVPIADSEPTLTVFKELALIDDDIINQGDSLRLRLWWRADGQPNDDYRLKLTLMDSAGQPQSTWMGQPLNGRYPTRAWFPGDRLRDDITLPLVDLPAGEYTLNLEIFEPLQTNSTPYELGKITLSPASGEPTGQVSLAGQPYSYWLWPQPGVSMPIFGENATVAFSVYPAPNQTDVQLKLVGPDEQTHPAIAVAGHVVNFEIAPPFASGPYRLRLEQWANGQLTTSVDSPPLFHVETQERQFALTRLPARPLSANFAGYVQLLGYDLPTSRIRPGESFPVTLYWQANRTIGADLIMFNHLVDPTQTIQGGRDRRAHEVYSTMLWAPGEIVADSFTVQSTANAPAGIYQLLVGLYLPVGEAAVSLPLQNDGQLSEVTSVALGPIKVGDTPPGLTVPTAHPQVILNQPFGDAPNLTLLGYTLDLSPLNPQNSKLKTQNLKLTLFWRSESPLPLNYTTFVHVRNAAGETIAQRDQPPLDGAYPTSLWDPGEIIADAIDIPLPENLPADTYSLVIGMYDFTTGQRLPVPGQPAHEVTLTTIPVGEP